VRQPERADSLKEAVITFDSGDLDQVAGVRTVSGNVILSRGTLELRSDRAVIRESPEGYMTVTLTSAPGKIATFRQKRDGGPNLWIEGQAERIEYEDRTELVRLYSNAMVKELEDGRMTNQITGPFISYDNRKEVATVRNDASGQTKAGGGRGTLILSPKRAPAGGAQ